MRNRYLLLADIVAVILAAWVAYAFTFGWLFGAEREEFLPFVVAALAIKLGAFYAFGMYRRYWRYAGFWDLMSLVLANASASLALSIVMGGLRVAGLFPYGFSRLVPPLDFLSCLALTVGVRAAVRAVAETVSRKSKGGTQPPRRVLIVGAGDAGTMIAREMKRNGHLGLVPVGFLDDDVLKAGKQIHGLKVIGRIDALAAAVESRDVDEVVIAMPTAGGATLRAIVERCQEIEVPSRLIPGIFELLDGRTTINRLRQVDISDLLRRPQVAQHDVPAFLKGARVVVTGAGGSIGSELCRQLAHAEPSRLVLLGHGENSIFEIAAELKTRFPSVPVDAVIADVRDRERLHRVFRDVAPTVVFHAAAHKHVPLMEDNASEAVTNNVIGTRNVVDAAVATGVGRFVLVSTDKAAAPSNVMGASKRIAETIVQRAARQHRLPYVVVRFGNVLGSRGSVVPTFRAQIERGGPVTVTHPEVRRYFMTIPEAVHLILQASGLGSGGELFVLDMGEPVLLRDMAADMIRLSGLQPSEIPIVFTGLRPGEKLDEILWEQDAEVSHTARGDVRRVLEPPLDVDQRLDTLIDRLAEAAVRNDTDRITRLFRDFIPSATVSARGKPGTGESGVVVTLPRS